ncbi:MAG: hypothetical protein HOQ24_06895 [Mycobacteriaceae bacterium]|nr:hypothetical protein [Mycobacteriaceae bacterium]
MSGQVGGQCYNEHGDLEPRVAIVESIAAVIRGQANDVQQILAAAALAARHPERYPPRPAAQKRGKRPDFSQLPGFPPGRPILERAREILSTEAHLNAWPRFARELAAARTDAANTRGSVELASAPAAPVRQSSESPGIDGWPAELIGYREQCVVMGDAAAGLALGSRPPRALRRRVGRS